MKQRMNKKVLFTVTLMALAVLLVPFAARQLHEVNNQSPSLEFIPLINMAPDEPMQVGTAPPACTSPDPIHTYAFYHCYTPSDIAEAYGVDVLHAEGTTGKGQTIVIVDSYGSPTALEDLQFFSTTFGLPAPDLTIIHPTGKPTYSKSMSGIQTNWAVETSLDLQWAHAMAPEAKLVLIAANPAETEGVQGFPSMFIGEQFAVNNYPGSVISQSFAVTEQSFHSAAAVQVARFDKVYQQAIDNHITVISASGDAGTANVDKQGRLYPFPTAQWPSSDPLVTSAGGTWLQYGWQWNPEISAGDYYSCLSADPSSVACPAYYFNYYSVPAGRVEAVWKEDWAPIATGGMRSALFSIPRFQFGISASLLQGRRGIPDLSWNAAVNGGVLVYTSFGGFRAGWHVVGGTSASTPQLAAMVALANQLRHQGGKESVGYLNPILYTLPSSDFNDVVPQTFGTGAGITTLDNNSLYGSNIPGMATTSGWDLTTGFGSPKADEFVHDLASAP